MENGHVPAKKRELLPSHDRKCLALPRVSGSLDSPVHSDGQQGVGGHIERDGAKVVGSSAQQEAVLPRQLLHHVVVEQEGTAHHRHQHVRHGQVSDQQVGQVAQLLVAGQAGDEEAVPHAAHQHDEHQDHRDDHSGHREGPPSRGVGDLVGGDLVVQQVVS